MAGCAFLTAFSMAFMCHPGNGGIVKVAVRLRRHSDESSNSTRGLGGCRESRVARRPDVVVSTQRDLGIRVFGPDRQRDRYRRASGLVQAGTGGEALADQHLVDDAVDRAPATSLATSGKESLAAVWADELQCPENAVSVEHRDQQPVAQLSNVPRFDALRDQVRVRPRRAARAVPQAVCTLLCCHFARTALCLIQATRLGNLGIQSRPFRAGNAPATDPPCMRLAGAPMTKGPTRAVRIVEQDGPAIAVTTTITVDVKPDDALIERDPVRLVDGNAGIAYGVDELQSQVRTA